MASTVINSTKETLIDAGVGLVGGGVLGAVAGRFSLLGGIPLAIYGHHSGNRWLKALGMGMALANGFSAKGAAGLEGEEDIYGLEGTDGFNAKAFAQGAKARVSSYFRGFREKLFLPAPRGTSGFGETDTAYFSNPYNGIGEGPEPITQMLGPGDEQVGIEAIGTVGQLSGGQLAAGLTGTGGVW